MTRVAVLGSGSWGTTFAVVLADAGAKVGLWGRSPEVCDEVTRRHGDFTRASSFLRPHDGEARTGCTGKPSGGLRGGEAP